MPTFTVFQELLAAVFAFVPYWLLGLPFAAAIGGGSTRYLRFGGLIGCAIAGLLAEYGFIVGVSYAFLFASALTLSVVWTIWFLRRDPSVKIAKLLREAFLFHLVALWVGIISPFAVLGVWGGDWFGAWWAGRSLAAGTFPEALLGRPPLVGGATILLWFVLPGLAAFQVFCCVASGAMLSALALVLKQFLAGRQLMYALWGFAGTAFFLHNTAGAWSKPLAAGLILAAVFLAKVWSERPVLSVYLGVCLTFCCSVATHQSSIFYLPIVVCCLLVKPLKWRSIVCGAFIFAAFALVVVIPFEAWSIHRFGWAVKMAHNPSVAERRSMSVLENSLLVFLTSLVAWAPLVELRDWLANPERFTAAGAIKASLGVCAAYVTTLAGTFIGFIFPFFSRQTITLAFAKVQASSRWMILSVLIVWIANAVANPYWSSYGCLQTGLQGFALLALWWLSENEFLVFNKASARRSMLFQALPWLALNLVVTLGLSLSTAFQKGFEESDYQLIKQFHLEPIGLSWFPFGHIAVTAVLCLCAYSVFGEVDGKRAAAPPGIVPKRHRKRKTRRF